MHLRAHHAPCILHQPTFAAIPEHAKHVLSHEPVKGRASRYIGMRAAETPAGFAVSRDWPTRKRFRRRFPEHATRNTQHN